MTACRIRDEANRARSEAAKEQPRTNSGFSERQVCPQFEGTPATLKTYTKSPTATAKSEILEVSRPAIERAETIMRKAPDLEFGKIT